MFSRPRLASADDRESGRGVGIIGQTQRCRSRWGAAENHPRDDQESDPRYRVALLQHRDRADDDFRKVIYQRRDDSVVGGAEISRFTKPIRDTSQFAALGKVKRKVSR